ncbi:regulating synaptic membrane exocytosis protein 1 [Trichonephila clavipes]|nr:regulating synaptic membrane exocytosis protein 1 [Trichonephila clavipes]
MMKIRWYNTAGQKKHSEKSKRRTKTIANTCEPKWNQTFVYSPLRRSDLQTRTLEITCWDYDRLKNNTFVGEVLIDLSSARINNENEWYRMSSREESLADQLRRSNMFLEADLSGSANSVDRLSPPSSVSVSRLSDSDISELDYDENIPVSRRGYLSMTERMPRRRIQARATRTRVSSMTIHRRLIERNLQSYRPLRHLPFTPAHCRAGLQRCLTRSG